SLLGPRLGVKKPLSPWLPLNGILIRPLHTLSLKGSTVSGSEVLPCSNASIVNSGANFVRLSLLAASKGLKWLCICKSNVFTPNGLINAGGRLPMLSTLILVTTTLRQGYNIALQKRSYDYGHL